MRPGDPRRAGAVLGVALVLLGLTVLIGWALGVAAITTIAPHLASMKPATALGFVLIGVSLAVRNRAAAIAATLVLTVVAGLSVIAQLTSTGLGVDVLVVDHRLVLDLSGRMALGTALSLLLLALAGLTRLIGNAALSQVCAAIAFAVAWTACLGYLYGASALYQIGAYSTIAVHTAIGLAVAAVASLVMVRGGVLTWTLSGRDPGAVMMRRVLPLAVLVLPGLGLIELWGRRYHWFEYSFATALTIGACAVVLLLAVGVTSRRLRRADLTRTEAELSLLSINATLEQKVTERSQDLARERAQSEVFRERDRIAADLHDNVVQILFAAGLQLDLLQTQLPDVEHSTRIANSIDDIHAAIAALRGSIFELKNPGAPSNLRGSLSALTVRAGRLMTSAPTLTIVGPVEDVPVDVATAVLAVCQEALSNVARHAAASHCRVEARIDGATMTLRISDDGRGMPARLPHTSGIENITARARALDGSAQWESRSPRGTTLTWTVPVRAPLPEVGVGSS